MKSLNVMDVGSGGSFSIVGVTFAPHSTDRDDTLLAASASSMQEVKVRIQKIKNGWSNQQRAERRCVGTARCAWLLNVILTNSN